jgi:hypothetical protein
VTAARLPCRVGRARLDVPRQVPRKAALRLSLTLICLLVFACQGSPTGSGEFVAPEVAQDAQPAQPPPRGQEPISIEEETAAGALVSRLLTLDDGPERDGVIRQLIALGPRYLEFFRTIHVEAVELDLLYIVSRIEREHGLDGVAAEAATETPEVLPEIIRRPPPDYEGDDQFSRAEAERLMATRLQDARRLLEHGRHREAERIAEAALVILPDTRLRADFEAVIHRARNVGQAELLIQGTLHIEPARVAYAATERDALFATPVMIRCFLKNVSGREITLRLNEGESRESRLQLFVRYDQLDYVGGPLRMEGNVPLPVTGQARVTLAPNQAYELPVPLVSLTSLDPDASLKPSLGRAEIEAALRVYGAYDSEGTPLVLRPVRFPRRELLIFPAMFGLAEAEARPLGTLSSHLSDGRPQALFLAAHLVGEGQRREAGDLLLARDFEDAPIALRRSRLRALSVIFGVGAGWDLARWREWWAENRLRH